MSIRLVDFHNDVITNLSPKQFAKYIARAEKDEVGGILVSVWTTEMQEPLREIRRYRGIIDGTQSTVKLLLHIEDAWFVDCQNIDELIACELFSVGLTWNKNNNLAGGANAAGGLTELGETVVKRLLDAGVVVDLAHLNKQSFKEVAGLLTSRSQKLFCSHTCFAEVNPHPRNLDREQIRMIVDSGGVVGLTFVGDFLCSSGRATIHDVYRHIAYFIENFGADNLAIGTDFFGTDNLPRGLRKYRDFKRLKKFLAAKGLAANAIFSYKEL